MLTHMVTFFKDDSGATAIEYGLIAALVSAVAIAALTSMGGSLTNTFSTVDNCVTAVAMGKLKSVKVKCKVVN